MIRTLKITALGVVTLVLLAVGITLGPSMYWWHAHGFDEARLRACDTALIGRLSVWEGCYEREIRALVKDDILKGLKTIEHYHRYSRRFAGNCHMVLHPIGRELGEHADLRALGKLNTDFGCTEGFIHGAVERKLAHGTSLSQTQVEAMCRNTSIFSIRGCEHGIGHGYMRNAGTNLSEALGNCKRMNEESMERTCSSGVFMEVSFAIGHWDFARRIPWAKRTRVGAWCETVDEVFEGTCYAWASKDVPVRKRLAFCRKVQRAKSRDVCFRGVGIDDTFREPGYCGAIRECWYAYAAMHQRFQSHPQDDTRKICSSLKNEAAEGCAEGAGFLAAVKMTGHDSRELAEICRRYPDRLRRSCLKGVEGRTAPLDFV